MFATPENIASLNRANVESFLTLANTAFASAERLAALNINAARGLLEDGMSKAQALLDAKNVQELVSAQSGLSQPMVERAVAYSRGLFELTTQTQHEISKILESQFADANRNLTAALDNAARNAPAGSDAAVAAVKSAIAAANSAYDNMSKAAKQVAEIAEANVTAATSATMQAVGAAAAKAKKAL